MRKNTREVFESWSQGREHTRNDSIWTDGDSIYSYGTILVERSNGKVLVNVTKYSQTTTTHQNGLKFLFSNKNRIPDDFIENVPMGVKSLT